MKNQVTNLITKIISILVIMLMMVNSSLMLVISVAVDAVQKIIDESKINAVYELNMEKYVNYKMGDKQGMLVQTCLKTGIEYQEGQEYVPIDTSNVIINAPKVNDKYPESVEVVTKSTKATNGDGNGKDVNYTYNKDNGELTITTENKADGKGNFYAENVAGARDEYQLDFYYDENCYNGENAKRTLDFSGKVELKLKDDRDIRRTQDISQKFEVAENVSGLVSADVTTSDIYNGYINANIQNNSTYRTEYTENVKIQTSYKEIADEITVNSKNLFVNNKGKESETQDIIYKSTNVNKNEILDKLGQDGYLQILDKDGSVLATINKDTKADDNGNVQVGYEGEKTELNFKFSKPVKLGDINIQNTKEIKETMKDANVAKVETRNTVSCVNNVTEKTKVVDEETKEEKEVENTKQVEVYNYVGTSATEIKEAKTDVKVTANNTNWTNNVQNDVTFTATLITSGPEYNLFKNPVIDIKLPKEVEKVILGNISVLYDNNLKIKNAEIKETNDGKVIKISIEGLQSSYLLNSMTDGANIIIPATVILNKSINSIDTSIDIDCYNENNKQSINQSIQVKLDSIFAETKTNEVVTESAKDVKSINAEDLTITSTAQVGDNFLNEGDTVYEDQIIKYNVKIKNNTEKEITGINVVGKIPDGMSYTTISRGNGDDFDALYEYVPNNDIKEYTQNIEKIDANSTIDISYEVVVNKLADGENKKSSLCTINVQNINGKILNTYKINNNIEKAELKLRLKSGNSGRLEEENEWQYYLEIDNLTDKDYENLNVSFYFPGNLKVARAFLQIGDYNLDVSDLKNKELNMKLEKIAAGEKLIVAVYTLGCDFDDNKYEYDLRMTAKVSGENINTYWSNENLQTMYVEGLEVVQTSEKEGQEIKYDEKVEYNVTIKNVGKSLNRKQTYAYIIDNLPEDLIPETMEYDKYTYDEKNDTFSKNRETVDISELKGTGINTGIMIPMGEQINVKIIAKANIVYEKTEISNTIIVKGNNINTKISNTIKNIILPYNYVEPDPDNPDPDNPNPDNPDPDNPNPDNPDPDNPNPDNPDNPNTNKHSISGLVWNDENKNGSREDTESLLSNITVKLFNIDTNEIAMNNSNKQIVVTDNEGKYKFDGVENGNYIVLFEYDTDNYVLTNYQVKGIGEDKNSDAILKEVSIDGIEKKVGLTDTLKVTNSNIEHIDMGLIKNKKFDLSLKKFITDVKVTNKAKNKTQNYEYNNTQLAKVEVPSKELSNTTLEIKYKIIVTNEGESSGYVNEILDYLPDGLSFSELTNENWTKNANGDLVSSELAGKEIKPGESKEVTLILTKELNSNSLGTIVNSAELSKVVNGDNVKDIDSVPANKNVSEDDYSEAKIIVSIKTGIVMYTILIIFILSIVLLIVLMKKNIISLKNVFKVVAIIFVGGVTLYQTVSYATKTDTDWDNGAIGYIKGHLSESGGSSTTVIGDINTNSSNFATHSTPYKDYVNTGKIHCADNSGTYSMCGSKWHKFELESVSVKITDRQTYPQVASNNTYESAGSTEVNMVNIDGYNIVGPYRINKKGSCADTTPSLQVYTDSSNNAKHMITDSKGNEKDLKYNEDFYIKVYSSVKKILKVEATIYVDVSYSRIMKYDIYERWKCTDVESEGHGHGCSDPEKVQPGEVPWIDIYKTFYLTDRAKRTVVLPGSKEMVGNLTIKKKDSSTGNALAGVKFQIKGPSGTFNGTTDKDGKIKLENLKPGKYTVTETATASGYYLGWQAEGDKKTNVTVTAGNTKNVEIKNKKYGSLQIIKMDADTGEKLSGATFKISGPKGYLTLKTTTDGVITLEKLELGEYTIKEMKAPEDYDITLQENDEVKVTVTASSDGKPTYVCTRTNKQYGNLKVVKKDKDSNSTSLGNIKLSGVQFKLYVIKDGQKRYLSNVNKTKYSYGDFSVTESNKASAKTFTTDDNAQFTVNNLPVYNGSSKITYYVQEYALPDSLAEFYDVKTTGEGVTISNGQTQGKDFLNEQKYVNLSGYVWEDVAASKQTTRNDVYDNGEKRIPGITVRLKKNDTVIKTTTTDQSGKYKFQKVDKTELKNYYVEFEYNGLKYQSVAYKNQDNGSRAIEGSTARTSFNNSFASITGGNEKGNSTTGYSRNTSGTVTNQLTYSNGQYKSALVGNTGYTASSATNSVSSRNGSSGATIKASTHESGYSLAHWSAGVTEIGNINLGIYLRDQPDMAIATDLDAIDLEMNGYNHTYKYNRRFANTGLDIFSEIQKWNNSQDDLKYPRTYTRKIYKDYIYASAVDGDGKLNEKDKLQVYLTYKIVIKNESSLYMSANEVSNYFDKTLDYSSSYYVDSNGNKVNVNWTSNGDKNGYSQRRTTGLKDVRIAPGSSLTVYLKMKKNTVLSWADKDAIEENAYSISEITSYSTYTKSQNNYVHYAGIDKDSAPDNIRLGSQNTYEDDTDSAPVVKITFDEPRTISGYVFEDKTASDSLQTNNERKGNGKYESNTDGYVENVKVELVKKDGGKAYIYPQAVKNSSFNAKVAEYTTTKDGKGYYEFVGVIPGEYYIKYTYPNGTTKIYTPQGQEKATVTTQDYKSTIVTSAELKAAFGGNNYNVAANPRWYQSQNIKGYSSALDDYTKRTNTINSELSTITGIKKTNYENSEYSQYNNIRNMTARTPNMTVAIENLNNEVTNLDENRTRVYNNIDFGIVERPRQSLALKKDISYIKLTLATGEVVVEGDPRDVRDKGAKMNYVTYPKNGILKIEADNDIIQGATLEIGYTINIANNSEKDYNTAEYYRYGTIKSGDKPVELTVNTVVDYVDQNLPSTYTNSVSNGNWYLATEQQIKNLTTNDAYNDIKARKNILLNDCNKTLAINKNTDLTQVKLSKILSTSEDLSFSNYAEAVKVSNPVGRFYGGIKDGKWINMTPGSLQISTKDKITATHELDDNSNSNEAKLAVVPSTGDSTIVYYILGITCLGIIVCGIVLIKKLVL